MSNPRASNASPALASAKRPASASSRIRASLFVTPKSVSYRAKSLALSISRPSLTSLSAEMRCPPKRI